MDVGTALAALIAAARLSGIDTALIPPVPVVAVSTQNEQPREILRLPLSVIAASQEKAYKSFPVGRGTLEIAAAFDEKTAFWAKFRQNGRAAAFPLDDLRGSLEKDFPVEAYRLSYGNNEIFAQPVLPPAEPAARVSTNELLNTLYQAAAQLTIKPVRYAALYEDGGLIPACVTLLRVDGDGRFWVTHASAEELKVVQWFLAINDDMFGMRIENGDLVFYSKPLPPENHPVDAPPLLTPVALPAPFQATPESIGRSSP